MKEKLIRVVGVLAVIQVVYLILVNTALNLPFTQKLVNQIKPDKVAVYWESAWTWYPLRVHATGVSINGQTLSQQWQLDAPSASASLSALPLLQRTVRISRIDAQDVEFRIRPRPKPDKTYADVREFFPSINDRDPASPASPIARKKGKGWTIEVADIHAQGSHKFWVYQIRGALNGDLAGNLSFTTRGGPFALSGGEADVVVGSLLINEVPAVSPGGTIAGQFEMAPFLPAENRGIRALDFLSADARVDLQVGSLDFLDFYLSRFNGMEVDGRGTCSGRLHLARGDLLSGSDLMVSAPELVLNADPYRVQGSGNISIEAGTSDPDTMTLGMVFAELDAFHGADPVPLFSGESLRVEAHGDNRLLPDSQKTTGQGRVLVTVPKARVPDLSAYQYLLPDKWQFALYGGTGELEGHAEFSASTLSADFLLDSNDADIGFKQFRFTSNLGLVVKARAGATDTASFDLAGTRLKLSDARLTNEQLGASKPWQASLSISEGTLGFPVAEGTAEKAGFAHLIRTMKEQDLREILTTADAQLDARLSISDLGWLSVLFRNSFDLAVLGSGEAEAKLDIRSGWFGEGTRMQVQPRDLQVHVLDYVAQGDGLVSLAVERGGETPDMVLEATLDGASFKRRVEEKSVIEDMRLEVTARAQDVTFGNGSTVSAVGLRVPSALVNDMSVYNQFLPEKLPLRLLGGQAQLSADIQLESESAGGYIKLQTEGLRSQLDEQQVSGELTLNVNLQGGVPGNMDFDISGSSLLLDDFRVAGEQTNFDQAGWAARFNLSKGQVVWKNPLRLDLEADIALHDTRPIVALLSNQRGKYGWIEKLLTVKEVKGTTKLQASTDKVLVPYAFAGSDEIDVGAKGVANAATREGVVYARFKKLHGILKLKDGKRSFDIIQAKRKFQAYAPGQTSLGLEPEESMEPAEPAVLVEPGG